MTTTKYWSERKAWLYLAERFKKARKGHNDEYCAIVLGKTCFGLCAGVYELMCQDKIGGNVAYDMRQTIPQRDGFIFTWSLKDSRGRAQRVAFCEKQAKLLRKVSG